MSRRCRTVVSDSARWAGIRYRDDDDGLRRHRARVAQLADPGLVAWTHDGTLGADDPRLDRLA